MSIHKSSNIPAIIILVILGGIFYFYKNTSTKMIPPAVDKSNLAPQGVPIKKESADKIPTSTVIYADTGFTPKTITIKKGTRIVFVNKTTNKMWIASDPHPTNQGYSGKPRTAHCPDTSGTAFDQCNTGNNYSFIFNKVGTWGYHNHMVDQDRGVIIVE